MQGPSKTNRIDLDELEAALTEPEGTGWSATEWAIAAILAGGLGFILGGGVGWFLAWVAS